MFFVVVVALLGYLRCGAQSFTDAVPLRMGSSDSPGWLLVVPPAEGDTALWADAAVIAAPLGLAELSWTSLRVRGIRVPGGVLALRAAATGGQAFSAQSMAAAWSSRVGRGLWATAEVETAHRLWPGLHARMALLASAGMGVELSPDLTVAATVRGIGMGGGPELAVPDIAVAALWTPAETLPDTELEAVATLRGASPAGLRLWLTHLYREVLSIQLSASTHPPAFSVGAGFCLGTATVAATAEWLPRLGIRPVITTSVQL